MTGEPIPREDAIFESAIRTLRIGFLVAAGLLVAGIVWSLIERHPLESTVLPFQDIPGELADGNPAALIDSAILAIMLSPVVAVLFVAWNFYRLGERRFALYSLLVLAVLAASIAIALLR